jgi:hypothetical protein
MPDAQRRALLLREWQGLSYREIAAELEVSQSAVETLIFRARRSLARGLEAPRERLRRVGQAIDVGAALSALKGALSTGAAVKAVVAGVAVTGLVAGIAEDRPQPRRHDAPPSYVPAATPAKPRAARAAQWVDAPRRAFAPTAQPRSVHARPGPTPVTVSRHPAPRHVPRAAPQTTRSASHPTAATPPPVPAPVETSSAEAEHGKPHEQQTPRVKPTGKPEATKPKQPDPAPKPKAEQDPAEQPDEAEPAADKGRPADPGSRGDANGKGEERR